MHRPALLGKMGNGHSSDLYLKQSVSVRLANYEPGGREFESLRARHTVKKAPTWSFFFTYLTVKFGLPTK